MEIGIGFILASSIISLLIHGFLVLGAVKKNKRMLMPWLVLTMISIVVVTGALMNVSLMVAGAPTSQTDPTLLPFFVIRVITIGLTIYCWTAVYSLYVKLGETEIDIVQITLIHRMA